MRVSTICGVVLTLGVNTREMPARIKANVKVVVQIPSGRPGRPPHYAATVVARDATEYVLQIAYGGTEKHLFDNVFLPTSNDEWNRLAMKQKQAAVVKGELQDNKRKSMEVDPKAIPLSLCAQKDATIAALRAEIAALKANHAPKGSMCSDSDSDNSSGSKNKSPCKQQTSVTEQVIQGHENVKVLTDEFKQACCIDMLSYVTKIETHIQMALALTNPGVAEDHAYAPELMSRTLALLGPSGSGKTMLAVALIKKLSENPNYYLVVRRVLASQFTPSQYYGATEKYIEKLTEEIKVLTSQQAPQSEDGKERQLVVVLVFDEYASVVGPKCGSTSDNGTKEGVQATIRIMFDRWKHIVNLVFLATSCPEDFWKMNGQEQRRFKTFDMPKYSSENIRQILISVIQAHKMELSVDNVKLKEISQELFACEVKMCDISSIVADVKQTHNESSVVARSKTGFRGKVSQKINYTQLTDAVKRFKCSGPEKTIKKFTAKKERNAQKSQLVSR